MEMQKYKNYMIIPAGIRQQKNMIRPGKPIEWVKIHNLPDHVYFNHSQHVKVGKQQCQTCHGQYQEMPEVASLLS